MLSRVPGQGKVCLLGAAGVNLACMAADKLSDRAGANGGTILLG